MQNARYQPVRAKKRKKQSDAVSSIFSSAIGGNNSSAIRMRSVLGVENFPRRDNFLDTNDIDFTKEFAESLADRCKSRPTSKMSNATLYKHRHDENDDFHFLTKLISRRTLNLIARKWLD